MKGSRLLIEKKLTVMFSFDCGCFLIRKSGLTGMFVIFIVVHI